MFLPTTPMISYVSTLLDNANSIFPFTAPMTAKAKALYEYTGGNPDELSFGEGELLSIVDKTEDEWWKAEKSGVVYIVPASYMEVVEG